MALKVSSVSFERFKLQNLYNTYIGLTPREQTMALIAAAAVLVLIIVLPVMVASGKISKLEKSIQDGNTQLKAVTREIDELNTAKTELAKVQSTLAGGFDASISTTLETLAGKAGIKDRIDSLKEKPAAASDLFDESSVDVRLKKVTLNELIDYLYSIEQNPDHLLRLRRLEVKPRYDNKKEFDVSFQVSTYRLLEGTAVGE
jgi:general secretion pathway protein M